MMLLLILLWDALVEEVMHSSLNQGSPQRGTVSILLNEASLWLYYWWNYLGCTATSFKLCE